MSQVGLISDTHDNLAKVRAAVEFFNRTGPDLVLHCGDFVAQFVLAEFGRLEMKLLGVFGNNDGDRRSLRERAVEAGFELYAGFHRFVHSGKVFGLSHEPVQPPAGLDYYVHGHTHRTKLSRSSPVIINPGEACGWLTGRSTLALLDTADGSVEFADI